jgi:hypothetical protein
MKTQRFLVTLTVINFLLLAFLLAQRPVQANTDSSVLRGRSLEILDDRGRVRASIKLHPADVTFRMPDGSTGYPETVVLRLIDPNGRPAVKVGASVEGGGLSVIGEGSTWATLVSRGAESNLRLKQKDGPEQVFKH